MPNDDIAAHDFEPASDPSPGAPAEPSDRADAEPTSPPERDQDGNETAPDRAKKGPLPYDRHEAILRKTREGYEQRLSKLSWAEPLDPSQVREAHALHQLWQSNPRALLAHLQQHFAGEQLPQPDLRAEDGTPLYSQPQMVAAAKAIAQQIVDERLGPLEQRLGPLEQWSGQNRLLQEADAQIEMAQSWKGFAEHIDEITDAIAEARRQGRRLSLPEAYIQVVVPTFETHVRKAVLDELNSTADRARGSVNPAQAGPASRTPDADKDWGELFREEMARRK